MMLVTGPLSGHLGSTVPAAGLRRPKSLPPGRLAAARHRRGGVRGDRRAAGHRHGPEAGLATSAGLAHVKDLTTLRRLSLTDTKPMRSWRPVRRLTRTSPLDPFSCRICFRAWAASSAA